MLAGLGGERNMEAGIRDGVGNACEKLSRLRRK